MSSNGQNANELARREVEGLPPWLAMMRQAAMGGVTQADVTEIVQKQVEMAKRGDRQALKFVFDEVLGGKQLQGMTLIQNNYADNKGRPDVPTSAVPGSSDKLDVMQRRAAAGLPLTNGRDREGVNLD